MTTSILLICFSSIVLVSTACVFGIVFSIKYLIGAQERSNAAMFAELRRLGGHLAITKGIHPHHANKDEFAPSTLSWDAVDKINSEEEEVPPSYEDMDSDSELVRQQHIAELIKRRGQN